MLLQLPLWRLLLFGWRPLLLRSFGLYVLLTVKIHPLKPIRVDRPIRIHLPPHNSKPIVLIYLRHKQPRIRLPRFLTGDFNFLLKGGHLTEAVQQKLNKNAGLQFRIV